MDSDWPNIYAIEVGKAFQVPMSLIDGRPWVPTEAEAETT